MRRDELGDLTAFLTVAEERSFTRAAARLGTSQSALSLTVRRLETRLGVPGEYPKAALLHLTRTALAVAGGDNMISLAALVPLILILMTITGAVYPAIDLTAGERERAHREHARALGQDAEAADQQREDRGGDADVDVEDREALHDQGSDDHDRDDRGQARDADDRQRAPRRW